MCSSSDVSVAGTLPSTNSLPSLSLPDINVSLSENPHIACQVFQGLIDWARLTMEEMCYLRWKQLGWEKMENGTIEPLFERRNPNRAIQDLVIK